MPSGPTYTTPMLRLCTGRLTRLAGAVGVGVHPGVTIEPAGNLGAGRGGGAEQDSGGDEGEE